MGVIWEEEEGHQVLKKKGHRQTDEKELPCGKKQHVLLVNLFCIVSVLKTIYNNEKYLKTLKEKDYDHK